MDTTKPDLRQQILECRLGGEFKYLVSQIGGQGTAVDIHSGVLQRAARCVADGDWGSFYALCAQTAEVLGKSDAGSVDHQGSYGFRVVRQLEGLLAFGEALRSHVLTEDQLRYLSENPIARQILVFVGLVPSTTVWLCRRWPLNKGYDAIEQLKRLGLIRIVTQRCTITLAGSAALKQLLRP